MILNRKNIYLTIFLNLFWLSSFSQDCKFIENTFYIVYFDVYTKQNSLSAGFGSGIITDIDQLKINCTSADSFICDFYDKAVYLVPPPLGYNDIQNDCFDNIKGDNIIESQMYYSNIALLSKRKYKIKIKLKDNSVIYIKINKINGEVLNQPASSKLLNNISHQSLIPDSCYNHSNYYTLSKINEVFVLSKKNIKFEKKN